MNLSYKNPLFKNMNTENHNNSKIKVKISNIGKMSFENEFKMLNDIIMIFKFIIEINLFVHILSINYNHLIEKKISKIHLKIKKAENQKLFSTLSDIPYPDEVYIERSWVDPGTNSFSFLKEENFVELIWNNNLYSCEYMFCRNIYITEIDLSMFDSLKVTKNGLYVFWLFITNFNKFN